MRWPLNLGGKTLRQWLNYVSENEQAFWSRGTIRIPHLPYLQFIFTVTYSNEDTGNIQRKIEEY